MLDLPYHPDVPRAMLENMEHLGRRLGLPLEALERIGQSLDLVERFILACEGGWGAEFGSALARGAAPTIPLVRLTPSARAEVSG